MVEKVRERSSKNDADNDDNEDVALKAKEEAAVRCLAAVPVEKAFTTLIL
jgi:hypothetical protein